MMNGSPDEKEVVAIEETNSACSELSTKASEVKDAGKFSKSSAEVVEAAPLCREPLEPITIADNTPKKSDTMGSEKCPIVIDEAPYME